MTNQSNPAAATAPTAQPLPPQAFLTQLAFGHVVTQALYVAAKLGIADFIAAGPRPVSELAAATNAHGIDEVLVQMFDVLDDPVVEGFGNADEIEGGKVLNVFAETDSACVGTDRYIKLCSHKKNGEILVHAGDAAAVELTDVDSACLE